MRERLAARTFSVKVTPFICDFPASSTSDVFPRTASLDYSKRTNGSGCQRWRAARVGPRKDAGGRAGKKRELISVNCSEPKFAGSVLSNWKPFNFALPGAYRDEMPNRAASLHGRSCLRTAAENVRGKEEQQPARSELNAGNSEHSVPWLHLITRARPHGPLQLLHCTPGQLSFLEALLVQRRTLPIDSLDTIHGPPPLAVSAPELLPEPFDIPETCASET